MRAVVQHDYGPAEVLHIEEVDPPTIGDGDVLVRVVAASVHAGNAMLMQGIPYVMRLGFGLSRPRNPIPGFDLAGVIEEVGSRVSSFTVGDEVFGEGRSSLAELAAAKPERLVRKPQSLAFDEAAVLVVSGLTALKAMRDVGQVQAGQSVLINGASGGVGVYAVQIAKHLGAEVTGVCGPNNVDLVRSLGADDVIDYSSTDVTRTDRRYDVILDNVGNKALADWRRLLTERGTLMPNSGTAGGRWLGTLPRMAEAAVTSRFRRQQAKTFLSTPNSADLQTLVDLVLSGAVRPVISATYSLAEAADAMSVVESGHTSGKVAILIPPAW